MLRWVPVPRWPAPTPRLGRQGAAGSFGPVRWTQFLACLTLCACSGNAAIGHTIVVPGPPSPASEPTPLAQVQPNTNHVHSLAVSPDGRRMLIATHHGLE